MHNLSSISTVVFAFLLGAALAGCGSGTVTATLPTAAAPTISPAGGTFTSAQTVTLSDATSGVTIYYTADGSTPTTASPAYAAPITVSKSETVSPLAAGSGYVTSAVATASFTITPVATPAATPTISPSGGTFTSAAASRSRKELPSMARAIYGWQTITATHSPSFRERLAAILGRPFQVRPALARRRSLASRTRSLSTPAAISG